MGSPADRGPAGALLPLRARARSAGEAGTVQRRRAHAGQVGHADPRVLVVQARVADPSARAAAPGFPVLDDRPAPLSGLHQVPGVRPPDVAAPGLADLVLRGPTQS